MGVFLIRETKCSGKYIVTNYIHVHWFMVEIYTKGVFRILGNDIKKVLVELNGFRKHIRLVANREITYKKLSGSTDLISGKLWILVDEDRREFNERNLIF